MYVTFGNAQMFRRKGMRFFVPSTNDVSHGEAVYQRLREKLAGSSGPLRERRICSMRFEEHGRALTLAVGDSFHRLGGQPVLAIVEGDNCYLICTAHHGVDSGEPYRVPQENVLKVEDFTAIA